ncbi:hypothetical protein [Aquimarina algiphila]|uniref:Uncharacterized protein n=1 Tax=Aquimarina algiphila TaxID=2047982 RepID=A0A554VAS6_9FLAO|nr:hypothetical protein [Aquimarina algiphila]TSE03272.1 hypothetical protein FOF46_29675 [Aquimarina algiphila]
MARISNQFPQLANLIKNEKIKELLRSPKYLDFSTLALQKFEGNYENLSLTEFKDKLWNAIVVNITDTTYGFPIKREDAFMEIAINRAKEMKLFTRPKDANAAAITLLENDEILFQENQNRKYAPTHDILEDWALTRYVSSIYEEYPNPKELFVHLGNEPAIRRAFRLWIEDFLIDDDTKIHDLIRASVLDTSLERYWADEILIAVFKVDDCSSFFSTFEKELLENKGVFLNRCLHLIKTACKESKTFVDSSLLLPIGGGWGDAITFIQKHISELNPLRFSICNFLSDWENRLLFQSPVKENEVHAASEIVFFFLKQIEANDAFWESSSLKKKSIELISLLYNFSHIAKKEITALIDRAFRHKMDRESWELDAFYRAVINKCLSGLGNQRLIKELPNVVISTAWREWKLRIPEETEESKGRFGIHYSGLRNEECWGIAGDRSFFPAGVYKMPIYHLLAYHPIKGMEFVISFINYSIDFYTQAECEYKHKIAKIELTLNDGAIISQWAAPELWLAYRGSSVTHYAIESMLMSLEKYLLDKAKITTKDSKHKDNLKLIFNYLLKNSNNVAVTSVLASVAMAYPKVIEEEMLPLFSIKEFYEWEITRSIKESSTLAPYDNDIPFAQKERSKLNQLPHRKKYDRGLRDFIVDYQFTIKTMNKDIHHLLDRLYKDLKKEDIQWRKILNEIDIRTYEVKGLGKNQKGFLIQPKYEKDIHEHINSFKEEHEAHSLSMNYANRISKAYKEKGEMTFETWRKCYKHYSKKKNLSLMWDRPITLAKVGLDNFSNTLIPKEKKWCIDTLLNSIVAIIKDAHSHNYGY